MQKDVRAWFRRRTFRTSDFDLPCLVEAKARSGDRISVVLPALNEERTVGEIVERIRSALVEDVPLVDELVVMDSGSQDRTAAVASAAGATVVSAEEILRSHGRWPGKGDVLWKSLFATTGDIVAFLDADLIDFDPSFVTGLVGPLLTDPAVGYVKGLYDRPLQTVQGIAPEGGGRVTELIARPLLNAIWPQLAGFVQPLSGEYAGRRSLLEAVPFASGYGVEIALLIDLLELAGLDALAQTDLGVRRHGHQADPALGRMAGQILQTALHRAPWAPWAAAESAMLTQFVRVEGGHEFVDWDVSTSDRPPMITVTEYARRSRALSPAPAATDRRNRR
ncbi:MAG: glucosyl-3-phosphoglycerate synthase [Actinomycetota bacterium]|nr:glucosyl-3-phosphoglycerate synthase [Actinomycetota bacterium]